MKNYIKKYQLGAKYTVKKGDNLSSLAKSFGVSINDLIALNPSLKDNPNLIFPGQSLVTKKTATPLTLEEIRTNRRTSSRKPIENPTQKIEVETATTNTKSKLDLTDFTYTPEELKLMNEPTSRYRVHNKTKQPVCLGDSWCAYDKTAGTRMDWPNSTQLKETLGIQSLTREAYNALSPKQKANIAKISYFHPESGDFTADSWDIHGILVEKGGKNIFTDPKYSITAKGAWNSLTPEQKKNLYKQMTPGTIIGLGGTYPGAAPGLNSKHGLADNRHSAMMTGYDTDGTPIIYEGGLYKRIDGALSKVITNITIPAQLADKTFEGLKSSGVLTNEYKPLSINLKDKKISEEMQQMLNTLVKSKEKLAADLYISPNQYDAYAKALVSLSMNETEGGKGLGHRIQTPLGLGKTIGITQLNFDNIKNKPELATMARKYGITKKSDLKDPNKAAIASMIYMKDLDKTSSILYRKGKESSTRTFTPTRAKSFNEYTGAFYIDETGKHIQTRMPAAGMYGGPKGIERSLKSIQADLDKQAPGIYIVYKNENGQIRIDKKTQGNIELTPQERWFYGWQSPNILRTGDARGLSAYVKKATNIFNNL